MPHVLHAPKHGCVITLVTKEQKRNEPPPFLYRRYGRRHWAVYCGEELVCVVVYRKGARAVIEWLTREKAGDHSEKGSAA